MALSVISVAGKSHRGASARQSSNAPTNRMDLMLPCAPVTSMTRDPENKMAFGEIGRRPSIPVLGCRAAYRSVRFDRRPALGQAVDEVGGVSRAAEVGVFRHGCRMRIVAVHTDDGI